MAATSSLFLHSIPSPRDWDQVEQTTSAITRARIFEAMATAVARRGYLTVTIGDVVKEARISRRTFYEHFRDKEHCFLETYRTGCENGIAQIDAAVHAIEDPDWMTRLRVSLQTYVEILASEPHFARVLLIDVLGAGAAALEMRERILEVYVQHYRGLREHALAEEPGLPSVPDEFLRALVGGIAELVQQCLLQSTRAGVDERLRDLTPTLVSFATAVLTGAERAAPVPSGLGQSTSR